MNTKAILSFMLASLIALLAVNFAMAEPLSVNIDQVKVNDVVLGNTNTLAGTAGESVQVVVQFTANANLQDLKLKVWIDGYRSEVFASTNRFDVINGSTYIKRLTLTLPSVEDMDNLNEGLTLYVRVADKNDEIEADYGIEMQRDNYALEFLSVDAPYLAQAGEIIPLDVVLKNIGTREAEDTFVTVSIPELGISKKAYFGDLTAVDNSTEDKEDARERRVYLIIPADTRTGDYTLQVTASNYDATSTTKKVISITGLVVAQNNTTTTTTTTTTTGSKTGLPTSVVVLTVVLVIVFVVLLIVLIVLLTKKPSEKVEDYGETSYY